MKRRVTPLYHIPVYFTNDASELIAFWKKHGAEEKEYDQTAKLNGGMYSAFEDNEDRTWRILCVFDGDPGIIAHEATHAAIEVAEHLEINIDFQNSEPVCYLVQWFFETMLGLFPAEPKGPKLQGIA